MILWLARHVALARGCGLFEKCIKSYPILSNFITHYKVVNTKKNKRDSVRRSVEPFGAWGGRRVVDVSNKERVVG